MQRHIETQRFCGLEVDGEFVLVRRLHGQISRFGSSADFGKFLAEEIQKWGKVVKFANIKVD